MTKIGIGAPIYTIGSLIIAAAMLSMATKTEEFEVYMFCHIAWSAAYVLSEFAQMVSEFIVEVSND